MTAMATKRVLSALQHRQGCFLAEAILHSCSTSPKEKFKAALGECCLHCDFLRHELVQDCSSVGDFHWKCAVENVIDTDLNGGCPRFFSFGAPTQHNFVLLMHRQFNYVPLKDAAIFCSKILSYRRLLYCDRWLQFLIQNIVLRLPPGWNSDSETVEDSKSGDLAVLYTSLSSSMMEKVQLLGAAFSAVGAVGRDSETVVALFRLPRASDDFWKLKLVSVECEERIEPSQTGEEPSMEVSTADSAVPLLQGERDIFVEAKEDEVSDVNAAGSAPHASLAAKVLEMWSDGQPAVSEDFQLLMSLSDLQLHSAFDDFEDFDRLSTGIIAVVTNLCNSPVAVGGGEALTMHLRCSMLPLVSLCADGLRLGPTPNHGCVSWAKTVHAYAMS